MQQVGIGIVVKHAAAKAALQAERAPARAACAQVERGHVACNFGNPVADVLRAACDRGARVLVAAVGAEKPPRRELEIKRKPAALDLAEVLTLKQDGRGRGIGGDGDDGPVDLGEEPTGAHHAPFLLGGDARFPACGALAEQRAVGQREFVADLRGTVELAGSGRADGAKARCRKRKTAAQLAREAKARIEDGLRELRRLRRAGCPCGAGPHSLIAVEVLEPVFAGGSGQRPRAGAPQRQGVERRVALMVGEIGELRGVAVGLLAIEVADVVCVRANEHDTIGAEGARPVRGCAQLIGGK